MSWKYELWEKNMNRPRLLTRKLMTEMEIEDSRLGRKLGHARIPSGCNDQDSGKVRVASRTGWSPEGFRHHSRFCCRLRTSFCVTDSCTASVPWASYLVTTDLPCLIRRLILYHNMIPLCRNPPGFQNSPLLNVLLIRNVPYPSVSYYSAIHTILLEEDGTDP